jgi:hypothetical protein
MNASTSYTSVQNAPHFIRMRWKHLAKRNAARAAMDALEQQRALHASMKRPKHVRERVEAYRSEAAGLKLKQAINQTTLPETPESEIAQGKALQEIRRAEELARIGQQQLLAARAAPPVKPGGFTITAPPSAPSDLGNLFAAPAGPAPNPPA